MPAERVSMRKIREALRLTHALGMSRRLVGEATGIGKTAVGEYVRRAGAAGLTWPIPDEIDDAKLERRLFRRWIPRRSRRAPSLTSTGSRGGATADQRSGHRKGQTA